MSTLETFARGAAEAVIAHPKKVITAFALTTLAWAGLAGTAAFSTDYRIFFAPEDPRRQALVHSEEVFTKTDNIAFLVAAKDGEVFSQDGLTAVAELTEASWKLPFAGRVDSVTNFQHAALEDDELVVGPLAKAPAALDAAALAKVKSVALSKPMLVGGLVAEDAGAAGVNVTLRLPNKRPDEVAEAALAARKLAREVAAAHPSLEIRVSGMAMMNEAFMAASIDDMSLVFPAMALAMLGLLWLLLGSGYATFSAVLVVLSAAIATLGAAPLFGYPLTPPSAAAPTIVLTLAIADAVHIIVSTNRLVLAGMTPRAAVVEAVAHNFEPVLFTSLTTMVGFLCLNFAEAPPFAHLANMTASGVVTAWLASVTLLPALLVLRPIAPRASAGWGDRAALRLGDFVLAARTPLAVGGVLVSLGLGVAATRLESNDQFLQYFDDGIAFRPDTERFMEELTGIYTLDFGLEAQGGGQITDPAYLEEVSHFVAWQRAQPEVQHVFSVTDVISDLDRLLAEGPSDGVPDSAELAGQFLLLYEMSLPMGLDLNDRVSLDKTTARVTTTVQDLSSAELVAFATRSERWLATHAPHVKPTQAVSPAIVFSHLADRNTRAMMRGNLLTLALISFALIFVLRSARVGLLSLLPNLMPIVATYGLWALLFEQINIVASVAGAVALGIIVDDTIHVLTKYQRARRAGQAAEAAAHSAVVSSGPAIVVTSVVLFVGFGILGFSAFQMTASLGVFTAMVCVFGLAADLLVLPPLLVMLEGRRAAEPTPLPAIPVVER